MNYELTAMSSTMLFPKELLPSQAEHDLPRQRKAAACLNQVTQSLLTLLKFT